MSEDSKVIGIGILGLTVLAVLAGLDIWAGLHLAHTIDGAASVGTIGTTLHAVVEGHYRWTTAAYVWCAGIGAAILALLSGAGLVVWWRWSQREVIDRSARNAPRSPKALARYEGRAKVPPGVYTGPGPLLGRDVISGRILRGTWEDVIVVLAGPRAGKTTQVTIPYIRDAPGAVIATSNKRDLVDATRLLREQRGKVWVFDPQDLAQTGDPSWWWNPLRRVTGVTPARKLAKVLADAMEDTSADSKKDDYFTPEGREVFAALLLAASLADRPMSQVRLWLADWNNEEPVRILIDGGQKMMGETLRANMRYPEKQKAGVYGVARTATNFLADPAILRWVEDPGGQRPEFDPAGFATSTETLYSLSKEGQGSAGPLVAALTADVLEEAERAAIRNGGRLAVPLLAVLDEVANVCRWSDLPNLYSHYGSRGIIPVAILQSWVQGEDCWGPSGMAKLWAASNIQLYLGSNNETRSADVLEQLSVRFGEYDRGMRSYSAHTSGRTTSWSTQRQRAVPVDQLASMRRGRGVLGLAGSWPVVVKTLPWWEQPGADEVQESIKKYGEQSQRQLEVVQ